MEASIQRGHVGKATYEAVQRLIADGKKATEAFAQVADETGRSAATVATAYYRTARQMPGGGGVKQRPRSKSAAGASSRSAPRSAAATTQALVKDLLDAANALARHAESVESELAKARRDSQAWSQVEKLVRSR